MRKLSSLGIYVYDAHERVRDVRRKQQPKPTPQSTDEMLKLINKAEAKRQRKNKARLANKTGE